LRDDGAEEFLMRIRPVLVVAVLALAGSYSEQAVVVAQESPSAQYRILATNRTSTMERELNEAASAGFRFVEVMGGETAVGGNEVVALMSETGGPAQYSYKLLATNRTSTMERELQEAADAGFLYRGQTIFKTTFGGEEVVCILERDANASVEPMQYKLLATNRTSTLEKELLEAAAAGYEIVGMTVAKTAVGGKELVVITRRTPLP
jgi:hypothetical protein